MVWYVFRDRVSLTPLRRAAVARASCRRTPWTTPRSPWHTPSRCRPHSAGQVLAAYPQRGYPPVPVPLASCTSRSCATAASTSPPARGGRSAPAASTGAATSSSAPTSAPSAESTGARRSPWSSRMASPPCSTATRSCGGSPSGRDGPCGRIALRRTRITARASSGAATGERSTTSIGTHRVGQSRSRPFLDAWITSIK